MMHALTSLRCMVLPVTLEITMACDQSDDWGSGLIVASAAMIIDFLHHIVSTAVSEPLILEALIEALGRQDQAYAAGKFHKFR